MSSIGDLFFTFRGDGSQLERDAQTAGGKAGDKAGTSLGSRIGQSASRAFTAGGAALGTFAAVGVEQFGAFEQKMNEVFTLLPGISQEAMGAMKDDVLALSRETGKMPEEVIPALYQALSAGVPPDNVFEFMRTANEAAVGGVSSLETAVDGISSVVNAYGDDVLSAGQASDLMFTAVKGGKTTYDELAGSLFQVVPTASALGVEFGNVTAALATMTAQGTPTKVATTQLRQLFVELSKEGGKASAAFEEMAGKSFQDFIAEGGNVADALAIMESAAADQGVALQDMFGSVEAGAAALQLTGRGAEKFGNELEAAGESAGATGAAFEQMDQGIATAGSKIAATASTIAIGVGEKFQAVGPALLALNQGGQLFGVSPARLFGGVAGAITGKLVPALIGGVGAVIPAAGSAIAAIGSSIGGILAAAIPVGVALLPVILVAALIAAIVAVIAIPELRQKAIEIGGAIIGAIGSALGAIAGVFGQIVGAVGNALGQVLGQVGSFIGSALGAVGGFAGEVVGFILAIPGRIASWVGSIVGQAVSAGAQVVSNVSGFVGKVVSTILGIPGRVVSWVGRLVAGAGRAASGFIGKVLDMGRRVISTILGIPGKVLGNLVRGFANIGRRAVDAFLGFIRDIPKAVGNILGGIGDFVGGFIPSFDVGALDVPRDMLAMVHKGEMIIPAVEAEAIRQGRAMGGAPAMAGAMAAPRIYQLNYNGVPRTFERRDDFMNALDDLDRFGEGGIGG